MMRVRSLLPATRLSNSVFGRSSSIAQSSVRGRFDFVLKPESNPRYRQSFRAFSSHESNTDVSESSQEALNTGRDLAKLALMVRAAKDALGEGILFPDEQVRVEQDIKESEEMLRHALENSGRVCSPDQLADRINNNIVPISMEALDYKQLMRAEFLRDSFEHTLVELNILPPKEAWVDGSDKPWCRLDRQKLKRKELAAKEEKSDELKDLEAVAIKSPSVSPIADVPQHEILRRKSEMEAASELKNVLKGFDTALLEVSRVHKVNKGGTTLSMRALVIIGDRNGTAGYGEGKSETISHAVERACRDAKRNLLSIDRNQERTIYHRVQGKYVKSRVSLWPAPTGTGISANNNFTAIFQLFGIKDVGAKLHGPRSLTNAVKALFNALSRVHTPESIAATRGLPIIFEPNSSVDVSRRSVRQVQ